MATVFYPADPKAAENLKTATIFTRINIQATPQKVNEMFANSPNLSNTFCLGHLSDVLLFDVVEADHIPHVRTLLQSLIEKGMKADITRCAFNKPSWANAGFHIVPVGGPDKQAFMVLLRENIAPEARQSLA